MKFPKLLPHLVGAIAILNLPAMVSPLSNADVDRMDFIAQELRQLRDYPNVMSPSELTRWTTRADAWINYWIGLLESIDLKAMTQSSNPELSLHAQINLATLEMLISTRDFNKVDSRREASTTLTNHAISTALHSFDSSIIPVGMNARNIVDKIAEGRNICREGTFHTASVVWYYHDNHGSPRW